MMTPVIMTTPLSSVNELLCTATGAIEQLQLAMFALQSAQSAMFAMQTAQAIEQVQSAMFTLQTAQAAMFALQTAQEMDRIAYESMPPPEKTTYYGFVKMPRVLNSTFSVEELLNKKFQGRAKVHEVKWFMYNSGTCGYDIKWTFTHPLGSYVVPDPSRREYVIVGRMSCKVATK